MGVGLFLEVNFTAMWKQIREYPIGQNVYAFFFLQCHSLNHITSDNGKSQYHLKLDIFNFCSWLLGNCQVFFLMVVISLLLESILGFPGGSDGKESACNARDPGSIPGLERSPGEGHGNPPQCSCLENPMDRGVSPATVHSGAKSQARVSS